MKKLKAWLTAAAVSIVAVMPPVIVYCEETEPDNSFDDIKIVEHINNEVSCTPTITQEQSNLISEEEVVNTPIPVEELWMVETLTPTPTITATPTPTATPQPTATSTPVPTEILVVKEKLDEQTIEYSVPHNGGMKSWMPHTVFASESNQGKLQKLAYTGADGCRQVNERYCIAIGSYFNVSVGQYVDLVLSNGTVISCIVGDLKADRDTDSQNIFTNANGCCTEFIVDTNSLWSMAKTMGNVSYLYDNWQSPVETIIVYNSNIF